jgi:hypothetical protein
MPFPNPDTQFKPGNKMSVGRPNPTDLTGRLRKMLDRMDEAQGKQVADVFVEVVLQAGLQGDFKFVKEIFDRIDGKVPDRIIDETQTTYLDIPDDEPDVEPRRVENPEEGMP